MSNMIAIKGFGGDAGASVWWKLKGNVPLTDLHWQWQKQGLPEAWLPELPTIERRLSRAVRSVTEFRKLARPVERKGHWCLVDETVQGDGAGATLTHAPVLTARVVKGVVEYSDPWHPLASAIAASLTEQEGLLHRDDLAIWLADGVLRDRLHAVKLRPQGGMYYVLPHRVETWFKIRTAIEAAHAGDCYTLPTIQGEHATRAVLDALVHEVTEEAGRYRDQIADGVGKRALRARVADCDSLLTRIASYESLLGNALESVRKHVTDVQDAAVVAAYAAEAAARAGEEAAGE